MVWSGDENEVSRWCKKNNVYDEIAYEEIEEMWNSEDPDEYPIRLNGKCVWETAKRVRGFINAREDLIRITSFGDYRDVMQEVMRVIKGMHNVERKRRRFSRRMKMDETAARNQRAKR